MAGSVVLLATAAVQVFDEITQALGATALGAVGEFLTLAWMANRSTPSPVVVAELLARNAAA